MISKLISYHGILSLFALKDKNNKVENCTENLLINLVLSYKQNSTMEFKKNLLLIHRFYDLMLAIFFEQSILNLKRK